MRFIQIFIGFMCFTFILSQLIFDEQSDESDESDDSDEDGETLKQILNKKYKEKSNESDETKESDESVELNKYINAIESNAIRKVLNRLATKGKIGIKTKKPSKRNKSKKSKKSKKRQKSKKPRKSKKRQKSKKHRKPKKSKKSKKSKKLKKSKQPKVTNPFQNILLPSNETCGLVHVKRSFPKVVGGKDSEIGAWPWLALLGYDFYTIAFMCGGALVTSRHVITAAHCINDALFIVRLGEFDLNSDNETKHWDVNITRALHAGFNSTTGRNDLAILTLEKTVTFTDLISPICLPIDAKYRNKSYLAKMPFVAGWGHTKENGTSATVLQELQTTVLENEVCYESFKKTNNLKAENQFDTTVLCVGDTLGGKDTCQGDSGGPLMMPELINGTAQYFIIGVVSQGIGCARKDLAGSYTNVPYYMQWILKNLVVENEDVSKKVKPWN